MKKMLEKSRGQQEANKEQIEAVSQIEQYNREIDEAVANVENGYYFTQEEVEQMAKEW